LATGVIGDKQCLRLHVKTHKSAEPALLLMHEGLKKFKCATIAEAEMLACVKAPDVLLGYQPVGTKADRFISLIQKYPTTKFSCLVDSAEPSAYLSQKAIEANVNVAVYIDLNVDMNRTGTPPDDNAVGFYRLCAEMPGIYPVGLHVYDGHITDTNFVVRKGRCDATFASVEKVKEALMKTGVTEPVIVAGGSATFQIHAGPKNVECSPGTFIYWDAGYAKQLPELPFMPAALVLTRVISLPDETTICTDLGHKAIASENILTKRVHFINAPELTSVAHSEEHLVLEAPPNHSYKIGDLLYGIPFHICPTCALYERALVINDGRVTAEWETVARARKRTTGCWTCTLWPWAVRTKYGCDRLYGCQRKSLVKRNGVAASYFKSHASVRRQLLGSPRCLQRPGVGKPFQCKSPGKSQPAIQR
jgi:D-serine deaminase-like pyridoxal phosphate-dependent protein